MVGGFTQSGLLFIPRRWQRANVLRWLKRVHAWTGFWGALFFLMMGTSGFLLNHRTILKIETAQPVEVMAVDIAVRPDQFADADAVGTWARAKFALPVEGRAPPAKPQPDNARFMGRDLPQPAKWTRVFMLPNAKVTVDYVPGSPNVSVRKEDLGVLAVMKNLHKGTVLGIAWVLLLDTIAGALVMMSLTGFLLWSRLHGPRLLAGTVGGGALAWALFATVPFLG